jgi:hypothetical protein
MPSHRGHACDHCLNREVISHLCQCLVHGRLIRLRKCNPPGPGAHAVPGSTPPHYSPSTSYLSHTVVIMTLMTIPKVGPSLRNFAMRFLVVVRELCTPREFGKTMSPDLRSWRRLLSGGPLRLESDFRSMAQGQASQKQKYRRY